MEAEEVKVALQEVEQEKRLVAKKESVDKNL